MRVIRGLHAVARLAGRGENRAVSVGLHVEAENGRLPIGLELRLQLHAVIEVEVAHAGAEGHIHLPAVHVIAVAIDDGPDRIVAERPAAGEDAVVTHGIERLPIRADQERRDGALDGGDAARGFGVARVDADSRCPRCSPSSPSPRR